MFLLSPTSIGRASRPRHARPWRRSVASSATSSLGESWRAASAAGPHRMILAFTPVALVRLLAPVASVV